MTPWIRDNSVAIVMALITMVSTYAVLGYRVSAVEQRQDRQAAAITALQTNNVDIQVSLAKIQTDIEYIKVQVNKIR